MKTIRWNNKARKQIKKVPKDYQESIFQSIDQLINFPNCTGLDIQPLKNHKYDYRMRVGRYRVFFDDEAQVQIIAIQEVKNRDNRTYQ
jgi:mRNA-degrading endonuclease RelE of RelBE toxin-antitoxin system